MSLFSVVAKYTNIISSYWETDDTILHVRAGADVFNNVRFDRGLGSRAHAPEYNEPFNSAKRLQYVVISRRPTEAHASQAVSPSNTSSETLIRAQLQACLLTFSLRLSARDVATVLECVSEIMWSTLGSAQGGFCSMTPGLCSTVSLAKTSPANKLAEKADDPNHAGMLLQIALPALRRPAEVDCINQLPGAFADMRKLAALNAKAKLFLLESQLVDKHGVLFHFRNDAAQSRTRHLTPSHLVKWPKTLRTKCLAQVHIPDCRIATLGNCHLVSFVDPPSLAEISTVADVLGALLDSDGSQPLHTASFQHMRSRPTFEIDGSVGRQALDKVLSPLVKSALSQSMKGGRVRGVRVALDEEPRPPSTVVI